MGWISGSNHVLQSSNLTCSCHRRRIWYYKQKASHRTGQLHCGCVGSSSDVAQCVPDSTQCHPYRLRLVQFWALILSLVTVESGSGLHHWTHSQLDLGRTWLSKINWAGFGSILNSSHLQIFLTKWLIIVRATPNPTKAYPPLAGFGMSSLRPDFVIHNSQMCWSLPMYEDIKAHPT